MYFMIYLLTIISTIHNILTASGSAISVLIHMYGYLAIFILMLLEGSSVPVPSEVVLPLAGLLSQNGTLNFYIAFIAAMAGSIGGLAIDYYIGYFLGKDVIYKHLEFFHIKKKDLDAFDKWFERNGIAAVFLSRLIPIVRTIMSFPAGIAKMNQRTFFGYSILGTFIWDLVLMLFGFYLLSAHSAVVIMGSIGAFAIVLYLIYAFAMRRMKNNNRK